MCLRVRGNENLQEGNRLNSRKGSFWEFSLRRRFDTLRTRCGVWALGMLGTDGKGLGGV